MSDKIDQRIVEMSFENAKFEEGIKQSKNSLKDFTDALKHSPQNDFSGLEKSVGSMSNSFSALREVAVGALRKIGEEAVMAGANLVKSIAIEPIKQGFDEMELKMGSTQTIMASTGESLASVNGYLEELNEYADQTIYSFSDMTSNIGKFTNAGVKLDLAVASIKGISNAAALSGANANEASRAMYNFAQALSSGYVKLIDWKSIELANMATVEFKQQLLESAVAAGTLEKTADGMYKVLSKNASGGVMEATISATRNFNDSLAYQWMTTDALTKTLANYSDATTDIGRRASIAATQVTTFTKLIDTLKEAVGSGWAQTFELIFGDFNEAKKLWTGINDSVGAMIETFTDRRNAFLKEGMSTGWKQFMSEGISDVTTFGETLSNVAQSAGVDIDSLIKKYGSMEEAVRHESWLTGDMLSKTVTQMTDKIRDLSGEELRNAGYTEKTKQELLELNAALKNGAISAEEFAIKMKVPSGRENILSGLKNAVVALLSVLKPISEAFDQIFPPLTAERFYQMTESFKNFTKNLIISDEVAQKIKRTFAGFFAVIDIGWQIVKFLGQAIFEVVKVFFPMSNGVLNATSNLGDFLVMVNRAIKSSKVFQYGLLAIKIAAIYLKNIISTVVGKVATFIQTLWTAEKPFEYLKSVGQNIFGGILEKIKLVTSWISEKFSKVLGGANQAIESSFGKKIISVFSTIFEFFKSLGGVFSGKLNLNLEKFKNIISNINPSKIAAFVISGVLLLFVIQILQFTKAATGFVKSITGITDGIGKLLNKKEARPNVLRDLALAIGVLAGSIWVLSTIPAEKVKSALIGLAAAIGIFVTAYFSIQMINVIASKLLKEQEMAKTAFNLLGLAIALKTMAAAIKVISEIESKEKIWGAVAVVAALVGLLSAYKTLSGLLEMLPRRNKAANNFLGISIGILGMIGAVVLVTKIPMEQINDSLAKIIALMKVAGLFQFLMALGAKIGGGNKLATSTLGMALGLAGMVGVVKLLNWLKPEEIIKGCDILKQLALVIGGFNILIGIGARIGGGNKFKANVLGLVIGMGAMVGLIALLQLIPEDKVKMGVKTLAAFAGIIGALQLISSISSRIGGGNKITAMLLSVTATMGLFVGIIKLLETVPQEAIDKGVNTIMKMAAIIAGLELVSSLASKISSKSFTNFIGVAITISILVGAIAMLSLIPEKDLEKAKETLTKTILAATAMSVGFAILSAVLDKMQTSNTGIVATLKKIIPGLTVIIALLGTTMLFFTAFAKIQEDMEKIKFESIGKFAIGVGLIGTLMIAFTALQQKAGKISKSGLGALAVGLIAAIAVVSATGLMFAAITNVLVTLDNVSLSSIGKFASGVLVLGIAIAAIALLAKPLEAAGQIGLGVIKGVLVVIAGLALIVAAFVGLAEALSLLDLNNLAKGFEALILVGENIGRFFGAVVGGFVAESLAQIGNDIVEFVDSFATIDSAAIDNIKGVADAMLALTAASLLDGLARFVSLDFFTSSGTKVGKNLKDLLAQLAMIPVEDATNAAAVLNAMAPMTEALEKMSAAAANIPNSGGWIGAIFGDNDADTFGKQLAGLVYALLGTAEKPLTPQVIRVATANLNAITNMNDSLRLMSEAAKGIPNSGGYIDEWFGSNDIDMFGKQLVDFVYVMLGSEDKPLTASVIRGATNNLNSIANMNDSLKLMSEAAKGIPNSGGYLGDWLGNNDIDTFGQQLAGFVYALFGVKDKPISITVVRNASNILTAMTEMIPALSGFSNLLKQINEMTGFWGAITTSNKLTTFVELLSIFVEKLSEVDFSIVEPALASMQKISISFQEVGATVLENAYKSFENNKKPFQESIVTIFDEPMNQLHKNKTRYCRIFVNILDAMLTVVKGYSAKFKAIGKDVVDGITAGITSGEAALTTAINTVTNKLVESTEDALDIHSPSKIFKNIGAWCVKSLALGITSETKTASKAGTKMAHATEEAIRDATGIHSISEKFKEIGAWIPQSVGEGIDKLKGWALGKAEEFGIDTSNITVESVVAGITGGKGDITAAIESILGSFGDNFNMDSFIEQVGEKMGGNLTTGFGNAITDSYSGLGGSKMQAAVKSELEKLKDYIEEENYFDRMSLEEELAAYKNLIGKYAEGSAERKELDREVYRLSKQIYEAQIAYIEGVTEAQKEAADERLKIEEDYNTGVAEATQDANEKLADAQKQYNTDTASAHNDANKKLLDAQKKYVDEYNKILDNAEKERQQAREDYADKQRSINEKLLADIDAQNKAYEDAVKSRADAIYSSYGLFDEVPVAEEVSGEQLLENLRQQGAALHEWKDALAELAARGVGDALIEELQQMGPSSTAQIKALLTLTSAQLDEYVALFQGKYAFARIKAETELVGLKETTIQNIQDLNAQAAIDLQVLEDEFATKMSDININVSNELHNLRQTYSQEVSEIEADLAEKLASIEERFSETSSDINRDLEKKLGELQKTYDDSMTKVNDDLAKKLQELKDQFSETMEEIDGYSIEQLEQLIAQNKIKIEELNRNIEMGMDEYSQLFDEAGNSVVNSMSNSLGRLVSESDQKLNAMISRGVQFVSQFKRTGHDASNGFAEGLLLGSSNVANSARYVAELANYTMKKTLQERSPSRVLRNVGMYAAIGFANGIEDYAYKAEEASRRISLDVIDTISDALAAIDETDFDFSPTITPVLDLSNIRNSNVSDLLDNQVYTLPAKSIRLANQLNPSTTNGPVTTTSIQNNFNLNGLTVRSEADIDSIATKLHQKQQAAMRGRGLRVVPQY